LVKRVPYEGAFSYRLENGLQVVVEERLSSRMVSMGVWVRAGSRDDPDTLPGLAHFTEHLLFRGTETRGAEQIAREIDAMGGYLNGATGKEHSLYYASVPKESFSLALQLLIDLVQNPRFDEHEVERERKVVLEEIRGHDDDPEQLAYDLFAAGLWKDKHHLCVSVLGKREVIKLVTCREIDRQYRLLYQPKNMILVVCGAVEHKKVFAMAKRLIDDSPVDASIAERVAPRMMSGRAFHERNTGQSHIYLGFPGVAATDDSRFPMEVANAVLGDGMSSRLFRVIREELGLAYSVFSDIACYSDAGTWIIYAATAPETVAEVVGAIRREIDRLNSAGIASDDIVLAKRKLWGGLVLSSETTYNSMLRLGYAAMNGKAMLSLDEVIALLEAVSEEDAWRVLKQHLREDSMNLAVIGPRTSNVVAIEDLE